MPSPSLSSGVTLLSVESPVEQSESSAASPYPSPSSSESSSSPSVVVTALSEYRS